MKPALLLISFALCTIIQLHAEPHYIVIHKRLLYGWKLEHVSKPEKRLSKWAHDKKNDTYYRVKSSIGIAAPAVVREIPEDAQYVRIKQGWGAWIISGVDKPRKKLAKWYHDEETGRNYRIKYFLYGAGRIK